MALLFFKIAVCFGIVTGALVGYKKYAVETTSRWGDRVEGFKVSERQALWVYRLILTSAGLGIACIIGMVLVVGA